MSESPSGDAQGTPGAPGTLAERIRARYGSGVDPAVTLEPEDAGKPASDFSSEVLKRLAERPDASGRYRLKGEVARGGMGAILRVWDTDLRRNLAMKVILGKALPSESSDTPAVDSRSLGRFLEEAQITGQLDHPGIVPVHELGLDAQGRVFFTMKLVKGEDLKHVFERVAAGEEGFSTTRVLGMLLKLCEAMAYAHAKGVIHRDLKPANVMVGKYGELYVMDWGLARVLDQADAKDIRIRPAGLTGTTDIRSERHEHAAADPDSPLFTMDGDIVGTPAYMPPEQATGNLEALGPASDVYAAGAMLYHLLTGRMPYVTPGAYINNYGILSRVQEGPPAPLHSLAPDVPAELAAICERAMARQPADRYRDMSALAEDLRAYLEHRVVGAYETGALAELRKWVARNKSLAASLAAAVVLLAGGLGASLFFKARSDENAQLARANAEQAQLNAEQAQANERVAEQRRVEADEQRGLAQRNAEEARANAAEAQTNAEEARRQEAIARRERDNVLRLSAAQELEDLTREAAELWPAVPAMLPRYDAWLAQAERLVDGLEPSPDGSDMGHRRQLKLLREQALPRTAEEAEAERASHPRLAELTGLERKLAWMKQVQAVRAGTAEPAAFELDEAALPTDASGLNELAWPLVDPDRTAFGREAEGLALARLAFERAEGAERVTFGDTLAWGLFAAGLDAEALGQEQAALAAAPEDKKEEYGGYLERMTAAVEAARGEAAAEALATVESERATLETEVSARRSFAFESEQDRWWHNQLTRLVEEIEAFAGPEDGLIEGISEAHGWGIVRRRAFAAGVEQQTVRGTEARRRWAEASASIADREQCPAYGGLALAPQLGLLPIGRNPASRLWEFWHVQSGDEPMRGEDDKLVLTEETGLVLVLLPGGSFWMGAQKDDPDGQNYDPQARSNESPVHEVALSPYFLSKYELTQGQWERFVGRNPSGYDPRTRFGGHQTDLTHPVEQVSWNDCMAVVPRLGLVLPTEAQWEYGARGGTETPWWTGPARESLVGAVNLADQAAARGGATWTDIKDWPELDDGYVVHAPVDSYLANPFGLHNVHGNVWEWCRDGYDGGFYGRSPADDPFRDPTGARGRVSRGGSFNSTAGARSAARSNNTPEFRVNNLGVRPAQGIATE